MREAEDDMPDCLLALLCNCAALSTALSELPAERPSTYLYRPPSPCFCRTPYLGSVSVLFTETAKLAICVCVQLWKARTAALADGTPLAWECRRQMRQIISQALPMLLPAAMFVMQQVRGPGP